MTHKLAIMDVGQTIRSIIWTMIIWPQFDIVEVKQSHYRLRVAHRVPGS